MDYDSLGFESREHVVAGAAAGLLGGAVFGAFMRLELGVFPAIGALYTGGQPSLAVGVAAHLFHSAVFGIALSKLMSTDFAEELQLSSDPARELLTGASFGFIIWVGAAVLLMPVWLQSVGFPPAPAAPNLSTGSLFGHVLYGSVAALSYSHILTHLEEHLQ